MSAAVAVELIDGVAERVRDLLRDAARRLPYLAYADLRLGVSEARRAAAENGRARFAGDDRALGLGARVLAGDRAVAAGYLGLHLGADDVPHLERRIGEALERAYRRAVASAALKAEAREQLRPLAAALADTRLAPAAVSEDRVPAVFEVDPRAVAPAELAALAADLSRRLAAADPRIRHNAVAVLTRLSRELFASTEGALVDQATALTQGTCSVVAVAGTVRQELTDTLGHQRGWEVLHRGVDEPPLRFPAFADFALALARDAVELVQAPPLPASGGEVVVVTDPHYNALVAHEIVGHPAELDRALKMEAAYAGRSWLLRGLDAHQIGRPVASPLVTAYSDPALPGFGHYRYDHEGTPGRRVVHIDRGVFAGFLNSRQTATVLGAPPNGHYVASEPFLVPLVRMSTTVFAAGDRDPRAIVREVDRGYYVSGHRIPSIAESRENFRISARKVYEIRDGELGRLYRDGGLVADSRDFLMKVDAVGTDLRVLPIPNCGKGQPMQLRRLGNGGPTLRSRARLAGATTS